jgi:hypothetical protein
MSHPPRARAFVRLGAALALGVSASAPVSADTRSDYNILCLDLIHYDPGVTGYPSSANSNSGTHPVTGGTFSWNLHSDGWMPGPGVPFLMQGADASATWQSVPIEFGAGCQFFSGTESHIVIHGIKQSAPSATGTAPAQIRVQYHVILENDYGGTGATVGATNGINISAPGQSDSTTLGLSDSGTDPVLSVPQSASVTDLSSGTTTRKEVTGASIISAMLAYGPLSANQVGITYYAGATGAANNPTANVTAYAGALGGNTAVTDVTSLDPDVTFTVAPEPGLGALEAAALATVATRALRRRR